MPTFNTFDPDRFTQEWSEQLTAAMIRPMAEGHSYDDLPHIEKIIDHCRQENAEGNPRAGQPVTVENLTPRDIGTLLAFRQLSAAAAEMLTTLILLAAIKQRAKWN